MQFHVNRHINKAQHGFIEKRGTTSNLAEFTHSLFDNFSATHCIFIVLAKAFDRVSHLILSKKLAGIATPKPFQRTIMNFVVGRQYALKSDGLAFREFTLANSSVPQGSHLGSLLFLVMVNDIASCSVGKTKILQYADDLKSFSEVISNLDIVNLQTSIDNVSAWSRENCIDINIRKTKFMKFKSRTTEPTHYFIGITLIEEVFVMRDLGVYFDGDINFKTHISLPTSKINAIAAVGYRFAREIHNPDILRNIVLTSISTLSLITAL